MLVRPVKRHPSSPYPSQSCGWTICQSCPLLPALFETTCLWRPEKRHPSLVHERSALASACANHATKLELETTTTTLPMALVPELSRASGLISIGTPKSWQHRAVFPPRCLCSNVADCLPARQCSSLVLLQAVLPLVASSVTSSRTCSATIAAVVSACPGMPQTPVFAARSHGYECVEIMCAVLDLVGSRLGPLRFVSLL